MKNKNDTPSWRALPSKEQSIFKNMMWLYEQKHNKKAVKQADLILKRFPEHGETLAMKGLILSNMGPERKQEAYEYARKGLRADITNCVCWHVLGLLYRQDRDYAEATKCFVQTLRLDSNNFSAMRDLAHLQIHERNYAGFLETRRLILIARSRFIREWAAFALANHLAGRLTVALEILDEVEQQFADSRDLDAFEKSEIILYRASLLEEMGKYKECYEYLSSREQNILDETSLLEALGRLSIFLRQFDTGRKAYRRLINNNKDNECYVFCLMACDENEEIRKLFALPRCSFNGAMGRADSLAYRQLEQLSSGSIFERMGEESFVYLLPCALRSSGEDRAGWLPSCFSRQAAQESEVKEKAMSLINGWRPREERRVCTEAKQNGKECNITKLYSKRTLTPHSIRVTREPTEREQELIASYFEHLQRELAPFPLLDYLPLSFFTGDRFVAALDHFLRPMLRKGVVSIFAAIRRLYTRNRVHLITSVIESYVTNLEKKPSTFGKLLGTRNRNTTATTAAATTDKREDNEPLRAAAGDAAANSNDVVNDTCPEEMSYCLLYTYLLLAQHYDFTRQTEKALAIIDKAIEHTPTFGDLYLAKGRICKHIGDNQTAAELHEKAREMDTADRYLNSKAVTYFLRVGDVERARSLSRLFSRLGDTEETPEAQCMWFELKMARALSRKGLHAEALVEYSNTLQHFQEIQQDQVDFHPYCMRKCTFRAYVAFLRMQDKLWSHRYYREAAGEAVRIYFGIHDGSIEIPPELANSNNSNSKNNTSSNQNKKKGGSAKQQQKQAPPQEKPATKCLTEKPLVAAEKILMPLLKCCSSDVRTWEAHYHLAFRKGAVAAMILSLCRLDKLNAANRVDMFYSPLFPLLLHFCRKADIAAVDSDLHEMAAARLSSIFNFPVEFKKEALDAAADSLVQQLNSKCEANPTDLPLRTVALKAFHLAGEPLPAAFVQHLPSCITVTEKEAAAAATATATSAATAAEEVDIPSLTECEELLEQLQHFKQQEGVYQGVRAACSRLFPLASAFRDPCGEMGK